MTAARFRYPTVTVHSFLLLFQAVPLSAQSSQGFWDQHGDKILVAVVTAIVVLVLSETTKALLKKLGARIDRALQAFGWRFRKRYLQALGDHHCWLKLIGFYHRAELHPPRLREVYVSLRLATGQADESPRLTWNEVFSKTEKQVVVLGPPGSGKSTLVDYLILVFCGRVRHPLREHLGQPFPLFGRLRKLGSDGGSDGGPDSVLALLRDTTYLSRVPAEYPERRTSA